MFWRDFVEYRKENYIRKKNYIVGISGGVGGVGVGGSGGFWGRFVPFFFLLINHTPPITTTAITIIQKRVIV